MSYRMTSLARSVSFPLLVVVLTWCHVSLVRRSINAHSPNVDELGHLAAGLYHWQTGRMDCFQTNPPLFRLWCSWPMRDLSTPDLSLAQHISGRGEWQLAISLMDAWDHQQLRGHLRTAREFGYIWSAVGMFTMMLLLYRRRGLQVATAGGLLWCFCPLLLTWSSTICPDAAAAALTLIACYAFERYLTSPSLIRMLIVAVACALAALVKTTLLILPPLLLMIVACRIRRKTNMLHMVLLNVITLGAIHFCYFQTINERQPTTDALGATESSTLSIATVLLPSSYVHGLGQQLREFQRPRWSFLSGTWREGGWPSFYLRALLYKLTPPALGILCASLLMDAVAIGKTRMKTKTSLGTSQKLPVPSTDHTLWAYLVPAVVIFVVVSYQSHHMSRHLRYVLPTIPCLYAYALLRLSNSTSLKHLTLLTASSCPLFVLPHVPHFHSYMQPCADCSDRGDFHVLDANVDWGEDIDLAYQAARQATQQHKMDLPAYHVTMNPTYAAHCGNHWKNSLWPPQPGRYFASVHRVLDPRDRFHFLVHFPVACRVTTSMLIYEVSAERLRGFDFSELLSGADASYPTVLTSDKSRSDIIR